MATYRTSWLLTSLVVAAALLPVLPFRPAVAPVEVQRQLQTAEVKHLLALYGEPDDSFVRPHGDWINITDLQSVYDRLGPHRQTRSDKGSVRLEFMLSDLAYKDITSFILELSEKGWKPIPPHDRDLVRLVSSDGLRSLTVEYGNFFPWLTYTRLPSIGASATEHWPDDGHRFITPDEDHYGDTWRGYGLLYVKARASTKEVALPN